MFCNLMNKEVELEITQKIKSPMGHTTLRICSFKYCDRKMDEKCLCNKYMGTERIYI